MSCRVKPGVNAKREGIGAVTEEGIEVCVAAQAREGEANKAVQSIIAGILKVPKSDVTITKGLKSRDKIVTINNLSFGDGTANDEIERIKIVLQQGVVIK
ncbi:hypothetical protein B0J11DRAFT_584474 [Dendryphion nanum]|uniref:Uncharacterized protein n=1 Tax=Dendryphion nanum TaxID=256645 RepID=A0A9P9D9H2_9PLEO|nr:hypothetical protein B0J11DRAFT_584474 [Dendryphion nanum]